MLRASIRIILFSTTVLLATSTYYFYEAYLAAIHQYVPTARHPSTATTQANGVLGVPWCNIEDVVHGHWQNKASLDTMEELQQKYSHSWNRRVRCDINPDMIGNMSRDDASRARAMKIADPEFVPRGDECLMRRNTWRSIVIMLLRMPAGLTIVGDSISQQFVGTFENMLLRMSTVNSGETSVWNRTIYLEPSHPDTPLLLEAAGVSPRRLEVPLVQHWRSHHLGNLFDLQSAFHNSSFYRKTGPDLVDWYGLYEERLRHADEIEQETLRGRMGDITKPKSEDSVFVIQTGPHWTENELGHKMPDTEAMEGFVHMVNLTESRMRALPHNVNVFWKSSAAHHVDCHLYSEFDNSRVNDSSPLDAGKVVPHNHNRLWAFNEHLYSKFSSTRPLNPVSWWPSLFPTRETTHQASQPIRLLDVWPVSVKRPDSHMTPHNGDCLHFCESGIPDEWFKIFWHMIMEDAKNHDYEFQDLPGAVLGLPLDTTRSSDEGTSLVPRLRPGDS